MKQRALALALLFCNSFLFAQNTKKVLFIGNSYTAVNNLPEVIKNMAAADGNTLIYSSNTPGGSTLQQQSTNPATLNLIQQGGWDFVVLQEQSQLPSFPDNQVEMQFYPYAKKLDSLIHVYNPCAKTVFYVTWGRKNGDPQNCPGFPPLCTYDGMDSLLTLRYTNIADTTGAYLSPVGPLWHVIRDNYPNLELYQPDESHPSAAGTYAAACSFYAVLFDTDVQNNSYNFSLSGTDAATIRNVAQQVVSDSLAYWYRFDVPATSGFIIDSVHSSGDSVVFANQSENATSYLWDFGDGHTDTAANPIHVFPSGTYTVCLTAIKGCDSVKTCQTVTVSTTGIKERGSFHEAKIYPNPVQSNLYVKGVPGGVQNYFISDLTGRKLQSGLIRNAQPVSVKQLPSGIYFLMLYNEQSTALPVKFVKE